jgi:rod shape-determining protein MreC
MRNYFSGQKQKTFFTLILIVALLFFLERLGVTKFLENPIEKFFRPAQLGLYKSRQDFNNFVATITSIGTLRARESDLERQNALLTAENARLKKLEEENKLLREQLGAKIAAKNLIAASVIGTDPLFSSEELILDKGKQDGVKEGALVVLKDILIGQISTVADSTSVVRLLTDPETKVPAATESGAKGILEGEFGAGLILTQVVQSENLIVGQLVYTLGEADFPRGLVLGKIARVQKNPADLFQKASIEPLIPFGSLDLVFIIK